MLTLRYSAAVLMTCLVWVGSASAQARQLSTLLELPEEELERLIYRRAEEIRTGTMLRPASAPRFVPGDRPGDLPADVGSSAPVSLQTAALRIAQALGVPGHLALGLIKIESNWNPRAVSSKGAVGLTQVLPSTARSMKFTCDLYEPSCNVRAGFTYLATMLDIFKDPRLALAAYNAGPGVFSKSYSETTRDEIESYVRAVITAANQTHYCVQRSWKAGQRHRQVQC